jgi:hypothetical protein
MPIAGQVSFAKLKSQTQLIEILYDELKTWCASWR